MRNELSVSDIFDSELPKILPGNLEVAQRINAVIGVEITGDGGGYWTLDFTEYPIIERGRTKEAKCTISATAGDFQALLIGGNIRQALEAFKEKRIQISGHLPTILKLEGLLRSFVSI
jgi:hypothetical protein